MCPPGQDISASTCSSLCTSRRHWSSSDAAELEEIGVYACSELERGSSVPSAQKPPEATCRNSCLAVCSGGSPGCRFRQDSAVRSQPRGIRLQRGWGKGEVLQKRTGIWGPFGLCWCGWQTAGSAPDGKSFSRCRAGRDGSTIVPFLSPRRKFWSTPLRSTGGCRGEPKIPTAGTTPTLGHLRDKRGPAGLYLRWTTGEVRGIMLLHNYR